MRVIDPLALTVSSCVIGYVDWYSHGNVHEILGKDDSEAKFDDRDIES